METPKSWRSIRGNSILHVAGNKRNIRAMGEDISFYEMSGFLLQFRAGEFRTYWHEEICDFGDLLKVHGVKLMDHYILFHENRGSLEAQMVPFNEDVGSGRRTEKNLADLQSDPPGRMTKADSRVFHICKYCPVKQKCDAEDKRTGNTNDWHREYPIP